MNVLIVQGLIDSLNYLLSIKKSLHMKKYLPVYYFILTATFLSLSIILDLGSKITGLSFVLLSSSVGILIGTYLRKRKVISPSMMRKKILMVLLLSNIILCLLIIILIDNLLLKQISICSLLLISSIVSLMIVFTENRLVK